MKPFSFARHVTALLLLNTSLAVVAAPAGTPDPTFNNDGKQTIAFDLGGNPDYLGLNEDEIAAMVMAPGGRIYVVGPVRTPPHPEFGPRQVIGVTRLLTDGSVDPTFGNQGRILHNIGIGKEVVDEALTQVVRDAALQADGKLLLAGRVDPLSPGRYMFACRLLADGQRDASFGEGATPGCRIFDDDGVTSYDIATAIFPQEDGRIVLAGSRSGSAQKATLRRINADGSDDETFGNGGNITLTGLLPYHSGFTAVTQMPDGDLVAVGWRHDILANTEDDDVVLFRVSAEDGSPIESFGPGGIRVVPLDLGSTSTRRAERATSVHGLGDGSLLVTGYATTDNSPKYYGLQSYRPFALKLDQDHQPDTAFGMDFGIDGLRVYDPCPTFLFDCSISAQDAAVLPDGRFVIAGYYGYVDHPDGVDLEGVEKSGDFFVMRLQSNGDPDTSFGPNQVGQEATAIIDFGLVDPSADFARAVVLDGERILVAGEAAVPPTVMSDQTTDFAIARLDHGLDATFEVTLAAGPNGQLSPSVPQQVGHSDHVNFDVIPAPGYRIATIEGCGGALYGKVYTTGAVVEDCAVIATFELKPVELFSDGFEP